MEYKGVENGKTYTITVKGGKVRNILVEAEKTYYRRFYQRGPVPMGLTMDKAIFEEAVLAICKKNLISWMDLFDAIWDDKTFGQELQQEIFEKHFN